MNAQSRTLKLSQLTKAKACIEQRKEFRARFGTSVEITPALCESVASVFDWPWAAEHLLSESALAEYERVTASAYAEYERVTESALAEYERVTESAYAEYLRVRVSAYAEYERVRASAFANAYIGDVQ